MADLIRTLRVNHINVVLEDYDEMIEHYTRVFDGTNILDLPRDTWHACLMEFGRVIFEFFAPTDFFLHTRYGPHYIGIEYQVEDFDAARAKVEELGIRVARDLGVAVHTNPTDCHGVSLELFGGFFHDGPQLQAPMKPAEYWRDEHPLGLTGLKAVTVAVNDLDEGVADFRAVFESEVAYEADRPAINGRAVGLQIADAVLEVVAPSGDGALRDHLFAHSEGIRSTVFGVRDLDQAAGVLRERGVDLVPGSAPDTLAIPPEQNLGVLFEFSE